MSANQSGTFEIIVLEAAHFLQPLADACEGGMEGVSALVAESGLDMNRLLAPGALADLNDVATQIKALYADLRPIVETGTVDSSKTIELLAQVGRVLTSIDRLDSLQLNIDVPTELQNLGRHLLDHLLIRYFSTFHPALYYALSLIGVLDPGGRVDQFFPRIVYSRIPRLITDLSGTAKDVYGWGTDEFDADSVVARLRGFLWYMGIPVQFAPQDPALVMGDSIASDKLPSHQLRIPLLSLDRNGVLSDVGIALLRLARSAAGAPGLGLMPYGVASAKENIDLGDGWVIQISGSADAVAPFGISLRPEGLSIGSISGTTSPPKVDLEILVAKQATPGTNTILVGSKDGTRLELGSVGVHIGLKVDNVVDVFAELPIKSLRLVVSSDGSDGFLSTILPSDGINAEFDLTLGYSWKQGVYFAGSAALTLNVPSHISLGPIDIDGLTLSAKPQSGMLEFTAGATIRASLGPLKASVENMGLSVDAKFHDGGGGTLGPLDLALGFKPPSGVGLSIDASVVKGGGYLYFDYDREEYAGVLELAIAEIVTVKAIGIINTKMPDGSKGFSLLIIITAEFGTGIQLGFGFSLIGLGGLLGLNRTMNLQPLMDGVRTGAINNIMFPQNPVENAPRIISDLRTIFPPYVGKFLIGPMAKLGWGTPALVQVSLGVIIEIPGNIAILGVLKVALPDESAPLIVIQVAFAGAIEFDKKRLYFFASMFESRVLFITIDGEMGLLVAWGGDANFVLSVGGFHPRFNPPPLPFPSPKRIALDILNTSACRIRVEGYFAVTSNTVQFGSKAELMFDVGVASVEGHVIFDALFQFSPFHFIIEISAGVSLKVFGIGLFSISLQFALEGPSPWRAHGTGTLSLLFFDVSASFDVTWGESKDTTLPPIFVMPLLKNELEKLENWKAELPAGIKLQVSLRELPAAEAAHVLHPLGMLRVSQRAVPLDMTLDKIGNQKPSDANEFGVTPTEGLVKFTDADEQFAKAQFVNMSDADKLSQRAYDSLHGGVLLSAGTQQLGAAKIAKRRVRYEQIIIDNNYKRFRRRFTLFSAAFFGHFLHGSAITQSVLSQKYRTQLDPFQEKVKMNSGGFTVAYTENNQAYSAHSAYFASETMAAQFLQKQVALQPELHESLHVIPQHEASL